MNKGRRRRGIAQQQTPVRPRRAFGKRPASTQKTKRDTRPAIRRSARWRARRSTRDQPPCSSAQNNLASCGSRAAEAPAAGCGVCLCCFFKYKKKSTK